jgi:membrane fusion protein, multidrug efflux system
MKSSPRLTTSTVLWIIAGIVIVGGAALYVVRSSSPDGSRRLPAPLVRLTPPERQTVVQTVDFTGDVVAIQQANIFAKVTGNLEQIYVDIGSPVRQYQRLALIDTTVLHQQYLLTHATYENARINSQRTTELFQQNLVSAQDRDNAEAAMKVAKANFEVASTQLGYANIVAPFSGYITSRYLDPGALVTLNNSTIFTLMDIDRMKIAVNVLEKDVPLITAGKAATITVDAYPGRVFNGTVTRRSEALDVATRTMAVEIEIPNTDHMLKPGMFANVHILVAEHRNAIAVPTESIMKDDSGSYVYTVVSDTARLIRITPGGVQGLQTEVVDGLRGNEPIITTGQQFARDGIAVSVQH